MDPQFGHLVSKTQEGNFAKVQRVIEDDPPSAHDRIKDGALTSHGTISTMVPQPLKMRKVFKRKKFYQLTFPQKAKNFIFFIKMSIFMLLKMFKFFSRRKEPTSCHTYCMPGT